MEDSSTLLIINSYFGAEFNYLWHFQNGTFIIEHEAGMNVDVLEDFGVFWKKHKLTQ